MKDFTDTPGHRQDAVMTFYRNVLDTLTEAGIPFLVGGSYALEVHAGIEPHTKDLDLFLRREQLEPLCQVVTDARFRCEYTHPHWLAKIKCGGEGVVDVIYSSGNGLCQVDDMWFEYAHDGVVAGRRVRLCPPEEMIWSKGFVMERERFDGADIAHFLCYWAADLDWKRLLRRFGTHWRVLLGHLILFGFIYPHLRATIPAWVMEDLLGRLQHEQTQPPPLEAICYGTLLSRQQYLPDIQERGFADARLTPLGFMSPVDVTQWTTAIDTTAREDFRLEPKGPARKPQ